MKKYIIPAFIAVLTISWSSTVFAQDDVYYDPSAQNNNARVQTQQNYSNNSTSVTDQTYQDNNGDLQYYDGAYSDDYYYSSRINRFYRPYSGFGYYDNAYVDPYYNDPYAYSSFGYRPSINLFFGNPYRFSLWNSYSPFYSPFGYSSFGNPYAYSGFGFGFGNYGFGNSFNYYNSYGGYPYYGGYSNYDRYNYGRTTLASNNGVYYGPRSGGAVRNPTATSGARSGNVPRVDPARATGRTYSSPSGYNGGSNYPGNTAGGGFVSPRNGNAGANSMAPSNRNVPRGSDFSPDRSARPAQMNDRSARTYSNSPSSNTYGNSYPGANRSYQTQRSTPSNNSSYTPSRSYSPPAQRQQSYSAPQRSAPSYNAPQQHSAPSYSAPRGGGGGSSSGGGSSHGGRH